jgi:cytochrome c5
MANTSGAKFAEPKAPEGAATTAAAPAAATVPTAAPAAAAPATPAAPTAAAAAPAAPQADAPQAAAGGEAIYKQSCVACHAAGVAGAPKFGDKAAWAPRLQQGMPALVQSVVKGKGAMPPKGGSSAAEPQLRAAVEYMVNAAK